MAWGIAKSLTRTLVVVVVMASCGGADNDSIGTTADDAETTTAPTTDQSGGPQLICEDPPPAEIGLGSPVGGTVAAATNFAQCFWVVVPEDVASISFELANLTADLRMFLAYGFVFNVQYPDLGESWSASGEGTADEIVVIDEPKPGPYFLSVASGGFRAESPFTLTVRTTPTTTTEATGTALPSPDECALPSQTIDLGSSVTSEIAPQNELSEAHGYFCVEVPDGLRTV